MSIEENIRMLCIISFLVTGLSHILQPRQWLRFFKLLLRHGYNGVFINGFITLPMGVLIVSFHNVWTGLPVVLTVSGWAYIIKATIAFCFPSVSIKGFWQVEKDNWKMFVWGGVVLCLLGFTILLTFLI